MQYRETLYMGAGIAGCSNLVSGIGDAKLGFSDRDLSKWTKIIVLRPIGPGEAEFSMGCQASNGFTEICDEVRRVSDGPFGMRIGSENRSFFIISKTKQPLGLEIGKLTNGGYIEVY